jgi:hypothetical protein
MNKHRFHGLSAIAALALALLPLEAPAQQRPLKEQIVGTWTLVSNDNFAADGTKRQPFGPSPKGVTIYDAGGRYIQIMLRSDLPNFKVNNRMRGTAEEYTTIVRGSAASFGTWSIDEANKVLIVLPDGSIFPNLVGRNSKRSITLTGDELRVSNPTAGSGGRAEQVWKRAK